MKEGGWVEELVVGQVLLSLLRWSPIDREVRFANRESPWLKQLQIVLKRDCRN